MNAKIYMSESRGRHEFPWFRSFHVFNFGDYQQLHRKPKGDLYVFNEDTLAGGKKYVLNVEQNSCIMIIPVAGAVICNDRMIAPGETLIIDLVAGEKLNFVNPYPNENEPVNFIQLWFQKPVVEKSSAHLYAFDISVLDNVTDIFHNNQAAFSIGKFKGKSNGGCMKRKTPEKSFSSLVFLKWKTDSCTWATDLR